MVSDSQRSYTCTAHRLIAAGGVPATHPDGRAARGSAIPLAASETSLDLAVRTATLGPHDEGDDLGSTAFRLDMRGGLLGAVSFVLSLSSPFLRRGMWRAGRHPSTIHFAASVRLPVRRHPGESSRLG